MLKTITNQENKNVSSIEGTDRLNATVAPGVKEQLNRQLKECHYQLTLNLENIKYIDSTGIGVLISALKTARENNGSFCLAGLNKEVMGLLTLMKLDKVFEIGD
ncbi:STAS domain-containing protein [Geofilum rhodophaeum]|uniref:STAS domain-containing protein n=1 Tax=Geofilum rhodophaeum TaxID=1965019 RepID=UPI000B51FC76|nr:STAS domain-containing protein [Geofilum rhodophaeum]